jgi:hypothetical protein
MSWFSSIEEPVGRKMQIVLDVNIVTGSEGMVCGDV